MFLEKGRTSKRPAEVVWRISIPAEGIEQSVEIPRISERASVDPTDARDTLQCIPQLRVFQSTATFALVMLATMARGDAYTFEEYQAMFARAGFLRSEFRPLPPTTQQVVVSYKA